MMKPGEDEMETTVQPMESKTVVKTMSPAADDELEPIPPASVVSSRTTAAGAAPPPHPTPSFQSKMAVPPSAAAGPRDTSKNSFARMQAKVRLVPDSRKGQLNTRYLATLPGVLKIAESILGFVAFILSICADRRSTSSAWAEHITFETTLVVCVFILLYVVFPHLSLSDERTREGLVVVELVFYGVNTLFFFIAIWLMVHLAASWTAEGRGAAIMTAILCLALCVLYAVETFIKFKAWSGQDVVSRTNSPYAHRVPPAPTHGNQQGNEGETKRFEPATANNGNEDHVVV